MGLLGTQYRGWQHGPSNGQRIKPHGHCDLSENMRMSRKWLSQSREQQFSLLHQALALVGTALTTASVSFSTSASSSFDFTVITSIISSNMTHIKSAWTNKIGLGRHCSDQTTLAVSHSLHSCHHRLEQTLVFQCDYAVMTSISSSIKTHKNKNRPKQTLH